MPRSFWIPFLYSEVLITLYFSISHKPSTINTIKITNKAYKVLIHTPTCCHLIYWLIQNYSKPLNNGEAWYIWHNCFFIKKTIFWWLSFKMQVPVALSWCFCKNFQLLLFKGNLSPYLKNQAAHNSFSRPQASILLILNRYN